MLDPANRSALTQELAPPRGFRLAQAVGTTFTLDLNAALAVPLAFSGFGADQDSDQPHDQRTSVIAALMSVAEKIDIFAQAGAIGARQTSELFELLGPMIHQVSPPRGMIFHPKAWFLEFENDDGERAYRLLCSSRNLTFDTTWDAMIRLDGTPAATPAAAEQAALRNAPLLGLLEHICADDMLMGTLPTLRRRRVLDLGQRLQGVDWDLPQDVRELRFQAHGVPDLKAPDPELEGRESLIVSPFLTPEGVSGLARRSGRGEVHLVSRAESLEAVGSSALESVSCWVLDPSTAEQEDDETGLSGLHAKILALSTGHRGRVLIGSANATGPGWDGNVELMVDVESTRSEFRPPQLRESFQAMLVEYTPQQTEPDEDLQTDELERLQRAALRLASVPVTVTVSGEGPYQVQVAAGPHTLPQGITRVSWHLLLDESLGGEDLPTQPAVFDAVELRRITPFIRVTAEDETGRSANMILLAELHGDPPDRREAIIAARLADPARLLQLIMMLLELSSDGLGAQLLAQEEDAAATPSRWGAGGPQFPGLLEALLRALAAGPDGMAEVQRLLEFIRRSSEAESLPQDFLQLWDAAWQAHRLENLGEDR